MLCKPVYTSLIVDLYKPQQTSLQLGQTALHYTLVFLGLFVLLYTSQQTDYS